MFTFTDVAKILNSDSIVKVRKDLEASQANAEKKQQEAQQAEQQAAQQAQEAQMQMEQEKENREDARKQLDSDTKIKVAMINAEARMIDADHNL